MAIAFFVWNNSSMINGINLKLTYYRNEKADLYLECMISSFDTDVLEKIYDSGIYDNIFFINRPALSEGKSPIEKFFPIRWIKESLFVKQYWDRVYSQCVGEGKVYKHIFLPNLCVNGIYFVNYFAKKNPKLTYSYIDEGLPSFYYKRSMDLIFYGYLLSFKDKLKMILKEFPLRVFRFRRFDAKLYLGAAAHYYIDSRLKPMPLPPVDANNESMKRLLQFSPDALDAGVRLRYYHSAKIIFLAQNTLTYWDKDMMQTVHILKNILLIFGDNNFIIKNHPGSLWMISHFQEFIRKKLGRNNSKKYYIDNGKYLFERNLLSEDFNNKIFVTINSATVLSCKAIYNQEPYVIFVHRLYNVYMLYGDDFTDRYAEDLKKMYTHPEKVIIPNTFFEFETVLKVLSKNIEHCSQEPIPKSIVALVGVTDICMAYLQACTNIMDHGYIGALDLSNIDSMTLPVIKMKKAFSKMNPPEGLTFEDVNGVAKLSDWLDVVIISCNSLTMYDLTKDIIKKKRVETVILEQPFFLTGRNYYILQMIFEETKCKAYVEYPFISRMSLFLEGLKQVLSQCESFHVDISGGNWGLREEAAGFLDMIHRLNGERAESTFDFSEVKMQVPSSEGDANIKFYGRISGRMGRCTFTMTSLDDCRYPVRIAVLSDDVATILYPSENTVTIAKAVDDWRMEVRKICEEGQEKFAKVVMEALLTTGECALTDYDTVVWEHVPLAEKFAEAINQANAKKAMKRKKEKQKI